MTTTSDRVDALEKKVTALEERAARQFDAIERLVGVISALKDVVRDVVGRLG